MPARAGWQAAALALLALGAAAAGAGAAVTVSSTSHLTTGVAPPPVCLEAGAGASKARHVGDFALSPNATSFSVRVKAKPGTELAVADVARVANRDDAARVVTLRAEAVGAAAIETFSWTVRNGSTTVAVLDHKQASPTVSFTLPAGARYELDLRIALKEGSGKHDASKTFTLRLEVA